MILGGPKDTITPLWTKGLKALVPPNSFGPPTMVGVVVNLYNRAGYFNFFRKNLLTGRHLEILGGAR